MSVTAPLYIAPPHFDSDVFTILFSALLGLASFFQLFNLVSYMAVVALINSAYSPALIFIARVEADFYMNILNTLVYVGVLMFMIALFFCAYVGNVIDLYVMLIVLPLIVFFVYILVKTTEMSIELKRETSYQFYERFCEADGKLMPKYLNMVYKDYEDLLENEEVFPFSEEEEIQEISPESIEDDKEDNSVPVSAPESASKQDDKSDSASLSHVEKQLAEIKKHEDNAKV